MADFLLRLGKFIKSKHHRFKILQKKMKEYKVNGAGNRIAALRKVKSVSEESPGFKGTGHQITSGWSNPSASATESYRHGALAVW